MDETKLQIQTHTQPDSVHPVTQYIYPCSGCKSRVVRNSREELLAAFTSVSDGQFMRSCHRCRAKGIQNRKRRREELSEQQTAQAVAAAAAAAAAASSGGDMDPVQIAEAVASATQQYKAAAAAAAAGGPGSSNPGEDDEDDEERQHGGTVDYLSRCTTYEEFLSSLQEFMVTHDQHGEFDINQPAARFRITLMSETVLPRTETCPARTVDAVTRDTHESQKLAALMIRDALYDATGYFFQLRKGGRPHPDGGKYNFSCSRAEERKGAYDRTKRMREGGGVRQRRTKTREFFKCEGRVMMCFSRTNSWITLAYAHRSHPETPKIHEKKERSTVTEEGLPIQTKTTPQQQPPAPTAGPTVSSQLQQHQQQAQHQHLPTPQLHHLQQQQQHHHHPTQQTHGLLAVQQHMQQQSQQIDPALMGAEALAHVSQQHQQQQQQHGTYPGQYGSG
ncbi:hypothetical protein BZA70DRAFT_164277 [Myxozyma melibiosi]|uniref:Uncharacterized protein n=1 Tax=Myxozyma melibiosi TaxID=54550 RepID=A0ABR1F922_9ASCO